MNGCAISNNGRYGIRIEALGSHFDNADFTAASVRFVNTYVWNNPLGGFYARLTPVGGLPEYAPLLVAPLVHCTFAYNGPASGPGWSIEVEPVDIGSGAPIRRFFWDDYSLPYPHPKILVTSLNNCVFQRTNPSDRDFGGWLEAFEMFDPGRPGTYWWGSPDLIGWAGLRAVFTPFGNDPLIISFPSPFIGPVDPLNRAPQRFFLDNSNQTEPRFFQSSDYLRAGYSLTEDAWDIEGYPRPAFPYRDKGGEED